MLNIWLAPRKPSDWQTNRHVSKRFKSCANSVRREILGYRRLGPRDANNHGTQTAQTWSQAVLQFDNWCNIYATLTKSSRNTLVFRRRNTITVYIYIILYNPYPNSLDTCASQNVGFNSLVSIHVISSGQINSLTWNKAHIGMIPLMNHDSRVRENSEVDIIYPHFMFAGWWYTYPSEKYDFVIWEYDIPNWM